MGKLTAGSTHGTGPTAGESMMEPSVSELEALIEEEKRLTSAESHGEAWAEGLSAGIEPEIIAEAALNTALSELVRNSGEHAALALIERMHEKARAGEFLAERTCH